MVDLTQDEKIAIYHIPCGRKEMGFGYLPTYPKMMIPPSIRRKLKTYNIREVYDDLNPVPMTSFRKRMPNFFILETPAYDVLIRTEGYDYARYATRLI